MRPRGRTSLKDSGRACGLGRLPGMRAFMPPERDTEAVLRMTQQYLAGELSVLL